MNGPAPLILIVEDEAQIRKFLRISLEAHGYRVQEARQGEAGLEMCAAEAPDLVILDLGLPDIDGQEFIGRLREWSQTPILVLSVNSSEAEKVRALDSGANDYVTKPFGIRELIARVRVILRDTEATGSGESEFRQGGLLVDFPKREVSVDGVPVHLSRKEYELLHLLVSNPGQVLTHRHILAELWAPSRQNETHYLRVLVGQLRSKLGDNPAQPRFIVTVQGVGYRLSSPED